MFSNSNSKTGYAYLLIALALVCGISQLGNASDNRRQIVNQLSLARANQSQSDKSKRLADNVSELYRIIGDAEHVGDGQNIETDIAEAVNLFQSALTSIDEETKVVLDQWGNYLKSVSHYSNADYFNAIKSQQIDYMNAIAELDGLIEQEKKSRKNHVSSWIDDLIKRFGKDSLTEKRDAIFKNLSYIAARSSKKQKAALRDLFYIEAMLYGSYREYFGDFLKFYNSEIDDAGRIKLRSRKDVAESLLEVIAEPPLQPF
jgi:hypothetical protein